MQKKKFSKVGIKAIAQKNEEKAFLKKKVLGALTLFSHI